MRVLFVDDEAIIREGLTTLIDWNKAGFEEKLEAANALQAIRLIEQAQPDLILTDIFMPEMSGIEFARSVKSRYPSIRFIILTGYEKFEYAKEAIEIGVSKYMVKPIFPEELSEAVDAIVAEIQSERMESQWNADASRRLKEYQPVIVEKFWADLIFGTLTKPRDIHERASMIPLDTTRRQVLYCAVFKLNVNQIVQRYGASNIALIKFAICNIAEEVFQGKVVHIVDTDPALLHGLFNQSINAHEYERLLRVIGDTLELNVCIGVGAKAEELEDVAVSANEAEEAVHVLSMMEPTGVIHYSDIPNWKRHHVNYPYAQEKAIVESLRYKDQLDSELIVPFVHSLELQKATFPVFKLMFVQLLSTVYRIADEYALGDEFPPFYETYSRLSLLESAAELITLAEALLDQAFMLKNRQHFSFVDQLVEQAKAIITDQYADASLTIGMIAKQLSITPNYLSRIFHEKSGITCVEHLTATRLDKAKKLLAYSSMKSYEIAEKVGYQNAHYFSVLFKKHTGSSPSEFRKQEGE